ncbi:Nif11-like leader peptide family natural product precursor [Synechococcus sp. UW179A]|uniref:Nif11-like leader peptide family natural product precursor n=1 Tax=Synechococcus sp. UW179A TaxID=2575510 RepID=UPI000E0E8537|nr:Nif11-like leader peptide family natural product precursor [Synechococcus sp. UW179A]
MPVSAEAEKALPRFVETLNNDQDFQNQLNQVSDIEALRKAVQAVDPSLTGAALIPLDQATRPPKILVDSGVISNALPWRLLRCTGGPLVLQLICTNANFAIWIESC